MKSTSTIFQVRLAPRTSRSPQEACFKTTCAEPCAWWGDIKSADELGNVIVKQEKGNIVYLRDIADVVFEYEEPESYARESTATVVMVDVKKRAGENLINASDQIQDILVKAKNQVFPENLDVTITGDMSKQTRTQVSELENSIIFGMILVITVLLFFLGLRNALFVGTAIPLSMFIAFFVLSIMGVTLNMMVLFSLVLALGMLVDNGIVVVENIYRLMDEGMDASDAAKYGVGRGCMADHSLNGYNPGGFHSADGLARPHG